MFFFNSVCAEGVVIAASNPYVTSGVAAGAGLGFLVLQSMVQSSAERCIKLNLFKSLYMCLSFGAT